MVVFTVLIHYSMTYHYNCLCSATPAELPYNTPQILCKIRDPPKQHLQYQILIVVHHWKNTLKEHSTRRE